MKDKKVNKLLLGVDTSGRGRVNGKVVGERIWWI
jgi:hypothetical protein